MYRASILFVVSSAVFLPSAAKADDAQFGVTLDKLEHLFDFDISVLEAEATYGSEDAFAALKVESAFLSGSYAASETQLYYSRSIGSRVSGIIGARHLDWTEGDGTSVMLGVSADLGWDIQVLALGYLDSDFTEGQLEFERPTALSAKIELQPKIELRAFSNDIELFTVEARLAYATTERLNTYVGFSWLRVVGTTNEQDDLTALAGVSYEW